MALIPPSWFHGRQGKAEEVGPNLYRLTGPNLAEGFVRIWHDDHGRWGAALRLAADGPDVASIEPALENPYEAWEAAFELYRKEVVI